MKKLTLLLAGLMLAGASFAHDGKGCCKKGEKCTKGAKCCKEKKDSKDTEKKEEKKDDKK